MLLGQHHAGVRRLLHHMIIEVIFPSTQVRWKGEPGRSLKKQSRLDENK